jgi:DNA-binding transcriptional ArsR family regulator
MVIYAPVPSAWSALSDPHRRAMLELLRESPLPVGELVARIGLTQPGTSKHLRALRDAGLVISQTEGQQRIYALDVRPLIELDAWLEPYRQVWERSLDALERHLDRTSNQEQED